MSLHPSTFRYLKPTSAQLERMEDVRSKFETFAAKLDVALPEGPDKTYVLRHLRETAMWANICITRSSDGAPRPDPETPA